MVVDLNSFHLESASSRKKNTFANPMFNFRELSRGIILHIHSNSEYIGCIHKYNINTQSIHSWLLCLSLFLKLLPGHCRVSTSIRGSEENSLYTSNAGLMECNCGIPPKRFGVSSKNNHLGCFFAQTRGKTQFRPIPYRNSEPFSAYIILGR